MKKFSSQILFISIIICLFNNCTKRPINGNLDGQWKVLEVSPSPEKTVIKENIFYNFQLHVCQLTYYGGYFSDGILNFDGKILTLDFPYELTEEDILIFRQYGIYENPVTFEVSFPDKKTLLLKNESSIILCQKY